MAIKQSRAVRWHNQYSVAELNLMREKIEAENPVTEQRYDHIYLYPKAVRDKFDDIAQAITWHMIEAKKAAGTYVEPA
jgi:hypothetical protein